MTAAADVRHACAHCGGPTTRRPWRGVRRCAACWRTAHRATNRTCATQRRAREGAPCAYCARPTTRREGTEAACGARHGCRARTRTDAAGGESRLYRRCAQVAAVCGVPVAPVWARVQGGATPEDAVERALARAEAGP